VLISSYPHPEALRVEERLRQIYHRSDQSYQLVDRPDEADVILVAALGNEISSADYRRLSVINELISRYPNKSFSLSYRDNPIIFHHGIYESGSSSGLSCRRVAGGAYALSGSVNRSIDADSDLDCAGHDKTYLFSFIGRRSHGCRDRLLSLPFSRRDVLIEDSSAFNLWQSGHEEEKIARERYYHHVLGKSKFSLCPRGAGTGSIRLFESMRLGVAPVIISDGWVRPHGPDWDAFSVTVPEGRLGQLEQMLTQLEPAHQQMGARARQAYAAFFQPEVYFNFLVASCIELMMYPRFPESWLWRSRHAIAGVYAARALGTRLRKRLRA
jgi:hypothetical protein